MEKIMTVCQNMQLSTELAFMLLSFFFLTR